jgi:hypothetical protein
MSKSIFDVYLFMAMSQEDPLFRQVLCHASVWSIFSWLWSLTHSHKHFVVPKIDILGPENWETDVNLIEFLNNQTETQKFDPTKSLLWCSEWVHSVIYSNMSVCRGEKIQIWSEWESHHEKSIWFPWPHNETVGRSKTSQIRVKNVFSCSDLVETLMMKTIGWKLIVFDRFIGIESEHEMDHSFFMIFTVLSLNIRPVMIELTVGRV